ncbi:hypothetical protein FisN_11Hh305 [Fistulifera solaris]|jgi:hypothetical protein|uniref:Uncharacterized protein n=1 Tax=Fistulifera solaris TaxID=1519565 RepID=A0A1Z5JG38_FISSO|nr:hypothetical protein FisN_11Hh305 [Fistulifera solaris]|eukprot:GAX12896.1 hypothetical protein FisN_11Hh305 [Fistulifera solaris]
MYCGGSLLWVTAWLVSHSSIRHDEKVPNKRFASNEWLKEDDPLRRRTMQSFMTGLLGMNAWTKASQQPTSMGSLLDDTARTPSLFTRQVTHPFSCEYTIQPPDQATIARNSPHHMQWTSHDESWQLELVLSHLPSADVSWNDLVHHRLLQVQHEEHCFVTCREEPFRLSSHALELVYVTTHPPLHLAKRPEWKTRLHWNENVLLSTHCHGANLPVQSVSAILDSIVLKPL